MGDSKFHRNILNGEGSRHVQLLVMVIYKVVVDGLKWRADRLELGWREKVRFSEMERSGFDDDDDEAILVELVCCCSILDFMVEDDDVDDGMRAIVLCC